MIYAYEVIEVKILDTEVTLKEEGKTEINETDLEYTIEKVPNYYYEWRKKKNQSDITVTKRPTRLHKAVFNGLEFVEWEVDREKWLDAIIRPKRNDLLDDVDLRRLNADKIETMAIPKKLEWKTYKQALKNLPETINYENPEWPIAPNEE